MNVQIYAYEANYHHHSNHRKTSPNKSWAQLNMAQELLIQGTVDFRFTGMTLEALNRFYSLFLNLTLGKTST